MGCGGSANLGNVYTYGRPPDYTAQHGLEPEEDVPVDNTDRQDVPRRRGSRGQDKTPQSNHYRGLQGQDPTDYTTDDMDNMSQICKYSFNGGGRNRYRDIEKSRNNNEEYTKGDLIDNGIINREPRSHVEVCLNGKLISPGRQGSEEDIVKQTRARRKSKTKQMITNQNGVHTNDNILEQKEKTVMHNQHQIEEDNRGNTLHRAMHGISSGYPRALGHMVCTERVVYPRDYFWWPYKKQLMGDFQRMSSIDAHALQVQEEAHPDLHTFLTELTRPCENEAETVRAIYRWLSANVAYMHRPETSGGTEQSALNTLSSRRANCLGFSQAFKYLLNAVDIECEIIEGTAKGASYQPGCDVTTLLTPGGATRHCWNRVKVTGCWFLCDVTWAAELELKDDGVVHKPGRLREVWFLTDPEIFVSTHMPLTYDDAQGQFVPDPDEQILYTPEADLQAWHKGAWVSASGQGWGVRPLSHPNSVITTRDATLRLTFKCPNVMTYTSVLTDVTTNQRLYGYVMIYVTGADCDVINVDVRIPRSGGYMLRIQALPPFEPDPLAPDKDDTDIILSYRIEASTRSRTQKPFSENDLSWGVTPQFLNTGCSVVDYKGAVVETDRGKTSISMQLPSNDLFPHLIVFTSLNDLNMTLDRCVYAERGGSMVTFHLTCPKPGEYLFTFWLKTKADDERLDVSISFLVKSPKAASQKDTYPPHPYLWGIQGPALPLGIQVLDLKSSTLVAVKGCCQLSVRLRNGNAQVSHNLEGTVGDNWRRYVYGEQDGDVIHYHFHIPEVGRFKFHIAGTEESEGSHQIAALFLIECPEAYTGPLYPEHENCAWGTRSLLNEYNLTTSQGSTSTVEVNEGKARIQVRLPSIDFPLRTVLTRSGHPQEAQDDFYVVYRGQDPKDVAILVHVPSEGYHALRLYEGSQGASLASYLLYTDIPCEETFEGHQGIYGTTPAFYQHGLMEGTPGTSYVKTDNDSMCYVSIKVPASVDLHFVVRRNGNEVKGHVIPERQGHKVVVRFRGRDRGFYQLRAYVKSDKRRHDLVLICLIENEKDCEGWEAYPECRGVWGLNHEALQRGIKLSNSETSESVLSSMTGSTTLTLTHPEDISLKSWIKPTPSLPQKRSDKCVLVEKTQSGSLLTVAVPGVGYFTLQVGVAREGSVKYKTTGSFLIESLRSSDEKLSFPAFANLYTGCRLHEPLVNPLTANRSYSFRVTVPGAIKVRLWDTENTLRVDLQELGEGEEEGEGVWGVMAQVGGVKDLWVTAKFPRGDQHGEGGCYRNLLMYEVR